MPYNVAKSIGHIIILTINLEVPVIAKNCMAIVLEYNGLKINAKRMNMR